MVVVVVVKTPTRQLIEPRAPKQLAFLSIKQSVMKSQDTRTSIKNWPCNLEKIYEDGTHTMYADDFNGNEIVVVVSQNGRIAIQADNGEIIKAYIENIKNVKNINY